MNRPAEHSPIKMPFIISSTNGEVDQATRKLIRSHVMRGKKGKRAKGRALVSPASRKAKEEHSAAYNMDEIMALYISLQPGRLGTQLHFVEYCDEVGPLVKSRMAQVSELAMSIIFPLLTKIGYHTDDNAWLYPTAHDVVALHINAFAMQSFIDRVLRGKTEHEVHPVALLHHQTGLKLLRRRILGHDNDAKISDATISAVLKLANAAWFNGEARSCREHMQGLRKMVDLRGGLVAFESNPRLLVEIWRCDLSTALLTGSQAVFYQDTTEPLPNYPNQIIANFNNEVSLSHEYSDILQDLSPSLAEIWLVMRKFCLLANLGSQTCLLVQPAVIYETMTSVMYRLLALSFAAGSLDENIRLSLLAFTHHTFLQWQDVRLSRHRFRQTYRDHLVNLQSKDTVPSHIMLWLLMIAAISLFNVSEEPWLYVGLQTHMEKCRVKSFKNLQEMMKSLMWITLLDDKAGKHVYDSVFGSSSSVTTSTHFLPI